MPEQMTINVYTYKELDEEARRKVRMQLFNNARRGIMADDEDIQSALQVSPLYPEGTEYKKISDVITERLYYYFSEEYIRDCYSDGADLRALRDGTLIEELAL